MRGLLDYRLYGAAARAELDAYYTKAERGRAETAGRFDAAAAARGAAAFDPLKKKAFVYDYAAENCEVAVFRSFPFYFEVNAARPRTAWYGGIGLYGFNTCGVDFSPVWELGARYPKLLRLNHFTDFDHRVPGYDRLLRAGLRGIYESAEALNRSETDAGRRQFRETVMRGCLALKRIAERMAGRARALAAEEPDDACRENLLRIASAAAHAPWEPPQTFYEALNTIFFFRETLGSLEGVGLSSFGQLDRMLGPYYERDLADGRITAAGAYDLLAFFLDYTDVRFLGGAQAGLETSTTVMIGGQDETGRPVFNAVTEMILRAYRENGLVNPKLNARVCAASPRAYLLSLARAVSGGGNYLAVENDEANIRILMNSGVSEEDARLYVGCGCQEIVAQGTQSHARAYAYVNLVQIFLDTLYGSASQCEGEGGLERLYAAFLENVTALLRACRDTFAPYDERQFEINPEPLLSATAADCLRAGLDVTQGGARYSHKTFSLAGFGTLCDCFLSLRRFVYEEKAMTLSELCALCAGDFATNRAVQAELRGSRFRYGNDDAEAASFAERLAGALAGAASGMTACVRAGKPVRYGTSLFLYDLFRTFGAVTGATPDGRGRGEPFSRGFGPSDLSDAPLTAAARAAAGVKADRFTDTAVFDMALPAAERGLPDEALADFIAACARLRIPVAQLSVTNRALLEEEYERPGTHRGLTVRVCGYSAPFGLLSREKQRELIGRRQRKTGV